jgi:hypothetical protein
MNFKNDDHNSDIKKKLQSLLFFSILWCCSKSSTRKFNHDLDVDHMWKYKNV